MEAAFDICCGVDVGKGPHHFVAIDKRSGELVLDEAVMQDEGPIREVFNDVQLIIKQKAFDISKRASENDNPWRRYACEKFKKLATVRSHF